MKKVIDCFMKHPKEVNETYWQHLLFASKGSFFLLKTGLGLLIHALLPFLFTTYTTERITAFAEKFLKRNLSRSKNASPDQP